jgi:sulfur relay (sulfurtransferase) DsrC/TusE family protein
MFDPQEYLRLAEDWSSKLVDETLVRVCIGRAYYAAHLSAREKIRAHYTGFEPYDGCPDEQAIVRGKFEELGRKDISNQLLDLLDMRVHADYYLNEYPQSKWSAEVKSAIELCKFILNSLEEVQ